MIISHRICADLRIDPGEGWGGAVAPVCPSPRGNASAYNVFDHLMTH